MDLDGTISTEIAIIKNQQDYNDIVTMGLPLSNEGKPVPSQLIVVNLLIPQGAKNIEVAKDYLKYAIQPEVNAGALKAGLGRGLSVMPASVKKDSWWFADPYRAAYTQQGVLGPTVPTFWTFNPAYAQVENEHVWSTAWTDMMTGGLSADAAAEKAFKRITDIFAKYPIAES